MFFLYLPGYLLGAAAPVPYTLQKVLHGGLAVGCWLDLRFTGRGFNHGRSPFT